MDELGLLSIYTTISFKAERYIQKAHTSNVCNIDDDIPQKRVKIPLKSVQIKFWQIFDEGNQNHLKTKSKYYINVKTNQS